MSKKYQYERRKFFRFHQYSVFYIYMLAKVFFSQLSRSRLGKFLVSPDPPFRYSEFPPKRLKSISNTRACQKAVCIPRGIVTCSGNINVFSLSWIGMSHSHRYVSFTSVCLAHAKIVRSDERRILVTCRQGRAHFSLVAAHKYKCNTNTHNGDN